MKVVFILIAVFVATILLVVASFVAYEHPGLAPIRATISNFFRQRLLGAPSQTSKAEQVLRRFTFTTVTANQSSFSAASIRCPDDTDVDADNDGDNNKSITHIDPENDSKWDIQSAWRRPSKNDDYCCCICLEAYIPGDTVCIAMTSSCDHVFHKDCILQWLHSNHNECPLCRVDLMSI
eukprot:scaffold4160_cov86-Cylindrotheca_fusiformis.AAC.3